MLQFQSSNTGSLYSRLGQRKYLTPAERVRFIEAARTCAQAELRTFCLVLAYTGCRISEALSLTPESVNFAEHFIAIRSLKKRGQLVVREIPVPEFLVDELRVGHCSCASRKKTKLWPWSRSRGWQLVKSVLKASGISGGVYATPKGLRHAFGLHAIRCGVPLNLVQRWLGHASMVTTAIYLQALGDEEREFAERMWGE